MYGVIEIIENTKEAKDDYAKLGWGHEDLILTKEHIQALLDGKTLAFNDGEYTHTLTLKEEK